MFVYIQNRTNFKNSKDKDLMINIYCKKKNIFLITFSFLILTQNNNFIRNIFQFPKVNENETILSSLQLYFNLFILNSS